MRLHKTKGLSRKEVLKRKMLMDVGPLFGAEVKRNDHGFVQWIISSDAQKDTFIEELEYNYDIAGIVPVPIFSSRKVER